MMRSYSTNFHDLIIMIYIKVQDVLEAVELSVLW